LNILIETDRIPEAAFFARTYLPSAMPRIVSLWKDSLNKISEKAAQSLADPINYENLFPLYQDSLKAQQYMDSQRTQRIPAASYPNHTPAQERDPIEEMKKAEESGRFHYVAPVIGDGRDLGDDLLDLEEKEKPMFKPQPPPPVQPVQPPQQQPLVPKQVSVSNAVPKPAISPESNDDFGDPELDLDIEGMNLDDIPDSGDINLDDDLLSD